VKKKEEQRLIKVDGIANSSRRRARSLPQFRVPRQKAKSLKQKEKEQRFNKVDGMACMSI
jgi:hypothetical protein